jgi:hypothetical protein
MRTFKDSDTYRDRDVVVIVRYHHFVGD